MHRARAILPYFVCSLCLGLLASSVLMAQGRPNGQRRPARRPNVAGQTLAQVVHGVVRPWIAKEQPPGTIVVVRRDGETHFFVFGEADSARRQPVTPDSIFELASITKVFTTTSFALEIEGGRMRLGDSVAQYIPYLGEHGGDIRSVTLEQLATHTSSLPRSPEGKPASGAWDRPSLLQWSAGWRAPYPPGSRSLYSNIAVGLLGEAIAEMEQKPLIEVWRTQFLDRLGMRNTFFEVSAEAAPRVVQGYGPRGQPVEHSPLGGWPAGGRLSASGRDMAEFLAANLGERPDLPRITSAMRFAQRPFFEASAKMTQGLAWQRLTLDGEFVIDKNGGLRGSSTYIGMLPRRRLGVVVMVNRGKCGATNVGRRLLLALVGRQLREEAVDEE